MPLAPHIRRRAGRSIWTVLVFLALFTLLVVGVCRYYLLPALEAAQHATRDQRRAMSGPALLVLVVLLLILVCGMLLSFGIGRYFFPRPTPRRTRTTYVDAWAEAGRRAEVEQRPLEYDEDDDADDDDP